MHNLIAIDKGALTMAVNVLRRNGKHEIADELLKTVSDIDDVLATVAKKDPEKYMRNVTRTMLAEYT